MGNNLSKVYFKNFELNPGRNKLFRSRNELEQVASMWRDVSHPLKHQIFQLSEFLETRTKVHHLDEGYTHIPKMRDFTEDLKGGIWGNQVVWA